MSEERLLAFVDSVRPAGAPAEAGKGHDPVVGWLVAVDGPLKGADCALGMELEFWKIWQVTFGMLVSAKSPLKVSTFCTQ